MTGCFIEVGDCDFTTTFTPDKLPVAKLGTLYEVEVEIKGGPGPVREGSFKYSIEPKNSGLVLVPSGEDTYPYNRLTIKGTPQTTKDISLKISGSTYGTSVPGHYFEKTFIIKVEEN